MDNLLDISQKFLFAVRMNENDDQYLHILEGIKPEEVLAQISTDAHKKAFWLNLYNAFNLYYVHKNPRLTLYPKDRKAHFTTKKLNIAGWNLSMDDIEHGILRRSKIKLSLGWMNKWFPSKLEKQLRVDQLDFRVHFALNCGGKSCPPIRFYDAAKIDEQLELATQVFLQNESSIEKDGAVLRISMIFRWYQFDFGGLKGVIGLFKKYGLIQHSAKPKLEFLPYDWHPDSDPFA